MSMTNQREWIDDAVCSILLKYGTDRHVDGHQQLTDFIMATLSGKDEAMVWAMTYLAEYMEDDEGWSA